MAPRPSDDALFPRTAVKLSLPDIDLELQSEAGLFSHRSIDTGTYVLLRYGPAPPESGDLLDLGCGYGAIALVLGTRSAGARVWGIDVDARAVDIAQENVVRTGLTNVVICMPRAVPSDVRFSAIYSNPPTRIGKTAFRSLLSHWLGKLSPTGSAYLVIKKEAGADAVAQWLSDNGYRADRLAAKQGYRLVHVRPRRL